VAKQRMTRFQWGVRVAEDPVARGLLLDIPRNRVGVNPRTQATRAPPVVAAVGLLAAAAIRVPLVGPVRPKLRVARGGAAVA
jgi:hypothetical protein